MKLRYEFAKVVKLKLDLVKLQSREDEITVEASFGIMYSVMDNGIQWIRYSEMKMQYEQQWQRRLQNYMVLESTSILAAS